MRYVWMQSQVLWLLVVVTLLAPQAGASPNGKAIYIDHENFIDATPIKHVEGFPRSYVALDYKDKEGEVLTADIEILPLNSNPSGEYHVEARERLAKLMNIIALLRLGREGVVSGRKGVCEKPYLVLLSRGSSYFVEYGKSVVKCPWKN